MNTALAMNTSSFDASRPRAIRAAQGLEPFDTLLVNAQVVDTATSVVREADIGLIDALIASVHPRGSRSDAARIEDLSGQYVAPGFIDIHVHFESSHLTPENYASVVVPQGTTTVFFDPHELANALGLEGVRYAIAASRGLPLRFLCAAPSSVPSAPGLEMAGADFGGTEMAEMLSWPEVIGVAEVMDMKGVLGLSVRMREILAAGVASGKMIEGHARGLSGAQLQAYVAAGVSSDHEIVSAEDAIEKLRAGLTVELRGSHDHLLPGVVDAINQLPQVPSTLALCTDDVPPDFLVERGGMCDLLRRLVQYGMEPVQAIRCATLNASHRLRRGDLGMVAAGRIADLVVLSNLREMTVDRVFCSGKLVVRGGKMLEAIEPSPVSDLDGGGGPNRGSGGALELAGNDCGPCLLLRQTGGAWRENARSDRTVSGSETSIDGKTAGVYQRRLPGPRAGPFRAGENPDHQGCEICLLERSRGRRAGRLRRSASGLCSDAGASPPRKACRAGAAGRARRLGQRERCNRDYLFARFA